MAKKTKSKIKNTNVLSVALLVIVIIGFFGYILPAYTDAKILGQGLGDKTGKVVGNVVGSFNGINKGLKEGASDGKEEGLSAKDTKVEIKNNFSEVGNLEVLKAGVKLKNVNTIGDDYAALFVLKGAAVYSVNIKDAEINDIDSETVQILLPDVDVEIYIDETETVKLAECQDHFWSGSARDGFEEYMNTRAQTDMLVKENIENEDTLIKSAEDSAKKKVEIIVKAATGNKKNVEVIFKKEVQANE